MRPVSRIRLTFSILLDMKKLSIFRASDQLKSRNYYNETIDFTSSRIVKIDLEFDVVDPRRDLVIHWEIRFLWPDLTYGPSGDRELLSRLWGKEFVYSDACSQISVLENADAPSARSE
jgi:hypothetical protein